MRFTDRVEAGRLLGRRLRWLRGQDVVVLGLPRGGVPVAWQVAQALAAPLDVIVVRKLGVPSQPELAMGAVGEDGVRVTNDAVLTQAGVSRADLAAVEMQEQKEVVRRAQLLRRQLAREPLVGRTAVIVDDGVATGATARAACQVARAQGAERVLIAVPVAPAGWARGFRGVADESICLMTPEPFYSVGQWYDDFRATTDDEVVEILAEASGQVNEGADDNVVVPATPFPRRNEEVLIPAGPGRLAGLVTIPEAAKGIVLFAHGSGSSRHSSRNQYVAQVLNEAGLGTVLFDLLTVDEERDRSNVFDVELLARRLIDVTRWVQDEPTLTDLRLGYFGASTGAAAALSAAAKLGHDVDAVVSRGGRPDLALERLDQVSCPTLLIVGGSDLQVLELNREAKRYLRCESRVEVVPGATHLFEEPGTLEKAADLARDWFVRYLSA